MGADEYTAVAGGSLKLKGVKDSKIDKKKKKKRRQLEDDSSKEPAKPAKGQVEEFDTDGASKPNEWTLRDALAEEDAEHEDTPIGAGKTEAERRHEERRRKRVSHSVTLLNSNFYENNLPDLKSVTAAGRKIEARRCQNT